MENIYERLCEKFAYPQMGDTRAEQNEILNQFISLLSLPEEKQSITNDLITLLRHQWAVETFALGVQLGIQLSAPFKSLDLSTALMDFLAQLDQPVS